MQRLWASIRKAKQAGQPYDKNLARFADKLKSSAARRQNRIAKRPAITYPPELPIAEKRGDIAALVREHQVVVVCGETGSGKSTQLPKILMELGLGVDGMIAHTQPRRIAARTLASRVADELNNPLGQAVGYSVRFNDTTSPDTFVRYLTDGLLLAELGRDRNLDAYDAIIVDEAHERSLNIDFLLGYLKRLLPRRPDLKVIITSATIDPKRFADFFSDAHNQPAPIIEVSGRTYPVEIVYRPLHGDDADIADPGVLDGPDADRALCEALDEVADSGDTLVFMPSERAIQNAAKVLRAHALSSPALRYGKPLEILPLYSRLSNAEQQKVFKPNGKTRRVIIATNVAESSVTVPNITAVIDPGTARISRYSPRTRMQRLPIELVSQASANQRAGRCGRVAPGTCVRLCSEASFAQRDPFTTPEILRTHLSAVILQMASLKLGELKNFPFLDPPRPSAVREGEQTLHELGALGRDGRLTRIGQTLARFPVDPRVGRMVLAGTEQRCLPEILIIASALEGQDPRVRPTEHAAAADQAHAPFKHPTSDFLTYLNLWDAVHAQKEALSGNAFKRWCTRNFLGVQRLREWFDLHRQLTDLARSAKLKTTKRVTGVDAVDKIADAVHRALLTGLLSNIALKTDDREYTGAGNTKLSLWPGSVLSKSKPRWMMCAETVATTRQFARTVAKINPQWIEPLAGDLVKTSHSQPEWNRRGGSVQAQEKITLFGLVLVPKRRIRLAKVDPRGAREIFIHRALVEQDADITSSFFLHNAELRDHVEQIQARQRRRDLVADAQALYGFYDRQLPADVCGVAELNRFLKREASKNDSDPQILFMTQADLISGDIKEDPSRPDHLAVGTMKLPLIYKHEPGADDDGVTLAIPLHALGRVSPETHAWGVPGLLAERITALIRSLPKQTRKAFVPAPQVAQQAAAILTFGDGAFLDSVADALGRAVGTQLDPALFDLNKLESHHDLNIAVLDPAGETLKQGRNLAALQRDLATDATDAVAEMNDPRWKQNDLTTWNFGDLPPEVEATTNGITLIAYPTLIDCGHAVNLRAVESRERADATLPTGVLRLAALAVHDRARIAAQRWPGFSNTTLRFSSFAGKHSLLDQLSIAAVHHVYAQRVADYPPRSASAFEALVAAGLNELPAAAATVGQRVDAALQQAQPLALALERLADRCPPAWEPARHQMSGQLADLLADGFITRTPWEWLAHLPRYFASSHRRLESLNQGKADRDQRSAAAFDARLTPCRHALADAQQRGAVNPELITYRWMLEEWRVSLFAESLGTSIPISTKRLDRQWKKSLR